MTDVTSPWFEFDEDEKCGEFQLEFLYLIRKHAEGWPCPPELTYVLFFPANDTDGGEPAAEHDEMRLVINLTRNGVIFRAIGASLEGDSVLCSELHTCNLALTNEGDDIVAREARGSASELAAFTAGWLGEILRRRTLRYDRRLS